MLCRLYYVMCDRCGELTRYGDTGREARRWARRWKRVPRQVDHDGNVTPGADYCPRCAAVLEATDA